MDEAPAEDPREVTPALEPAPGYKDDHEADVASPQTPPIRT
jgi:hypothetical protein